MPRKKKPTIKLLNLDGGQGTRMPADKYEALRDAILQVLPSTEEGIVFTELATAIAPLLPRDLFEGGSFASLATAVKLDMEARGLITRVPDSSPQRLRRGPG